MQHAYCGFQLHVQCSAGSIDDRILIGHAARIVWVLNACKFFAEGIDDMILVGHAAGIVWVSNACRMLGRKHR